jgi:hypothetical protein
MNKIQNHFLAAQAFGQRLLSACGVLRRISAAGGQ